MKKGTKLNRRRKGTRYIDEDGNIRTLGDNENRPVKKYTQEDLRLFLDVINGYESPDQRSERKRRNGQGLQKFTAYI